MIKTLAYVVSMILFAIAALYLFRMQHRPQASSGKMPPSKSYSKIASDEDLAAALSPLQAALDGTVREMAKIELQPMANDDLMVSKVGGAPYLRKDESVPKTVDGQEMVLLAQINFVDVPAMAGYPTQGILQFFIVGKSDDYVYGMNLKEFTPAAMQVQHAFRIRFVERPVADPEQWQWTNYSEAEYDTPHDVRKPRRMVFKPSQEKISIVDTNFSQVVGMNWYDWVDGIVAKLQVNEDDFVDRAFPSSAGHKLGGYPYFTQEDPRPTGSPLRLLLQLDSDDDMMWGDVGVGGFFIDPKDLANKDFSKVLYSWDCH